MSKPSAVGSSRPKSTSDVTAVLTTKDRLATWQHSVAVKHWRFALSGLVTAIAAGAVGLNIGLVSLWERQTQSLYFELRGPVTAPENVVILAIDEDSLSQGQYYSEDPERYESLQLIESWPWQRQAYAKAITRLMESGARAVAIDVTFPSPSYYGDEDDDALAEVIEKYGDRIVLAADYSSQEIAQGSLSRPSLPLAKFRDAGAQVGLINFHKEHNQQIHRLGQAYIRDQIENEAHLWDAAATVKDVPEPPLLSFAQATLNAADTTYNTSPKENIFFYGPHKTFKHIPFWHVLDDDPWKNKLEGSDLFQDKMVLIGTTAAVHRDFHASPFSDSRLYPTPMSGVEILANTVATLENDLSPQQLVKSPLLNALIILAMGLTVAGLMNRTQKPLIRALVCLR